MFNLVRMTREISLPRLAWKKIFSWVLSIGFASLVLPERTESIDFRVLHQPLQHQLEESSPAVSALQDTRISFHFKREGSGNYAVLKADKPAQHLNVPKRMIALNGITIRAKASEKSSKSVASTGQINRLNARLQLAEQFLFEHPAAPTFQEEARHLVQEEIERRREQQDKKVREIQTASGKSIFVYLPNSKAKAPTERPSSKSHLARNTRKPTSSEPRAPRTPLNPSRTIDYPEGLDPLGFDQQKPEPQQKELIGTIALPQGLEEHLKRGSLAVLQKSYGEVISEGYFLSDRKTFKIPVQSDAGELHLQLRDELGILVAQSAVPVASIHGEVQYRLQAIEDGLTVAVIGPKAQRLQEKVTIDIAMGVDRADLTAKTGYQYSNEKIIAPSTAFAQVSGARKFVPTIQNFIAGETNVFSLFSLDRLDELLKKFDLGRWWVDKQAAVLGQVKWKGQPMTHAVIDLAFREDEKVHYLGSDKAPALQMTGDTGQFFIAGLDSGIEFLRVQQIGLRSYPILIATIKENLTQLNLTMSSRRTVKVLPHELFTPTVVNTLGNVLGDEEVFTANDDGELIVAGNFLSGQTLVEIDGGQNYHLSRVSLNQHSREVAAPLVSKQWTTQLRNSGELDAALLPTYVLGSATGAAFEVAVRGGSASPIQVIYFNEDGTVRKDGASPSGGTYLMAGLEPGLHILEFSVAGSDKKILQQVFVDERAVQIASINFEAL